MPLRTCCCSTSRPTTSTSTPCCGSRTGSPAIPGTLLLITHDRDFLDGVVDGIVHVDARKLKSYTGNYSQFERERALQLALQQATYAKQQRQIAHLQAFIDRFRAKATKAKQAQSRIKALERMERIAAAHVDSPFEFAFAPRGRRPRSSSCSSSTRRSATTTRPPVLADLDWGILAGDRIGLLGPNGAGKSTLLEGDRRRRSRRAAGARHTRAERSRSAISRSIRSSSCAPTNRRCGILRSIDPDGARAGAARFPGRLRFSRRHGDAPGRPLLRRREGAAHARAASSASSPNLLLLDEPTNHLDIEMREALAEALQDYDGALVVVAHDRHLLRATTDALVARRRRPRRAVRRRSRRLPRLGAGAQPPCRRWPATRGAARQSQGAKARGSRGAAAQLRAAKAAHRQAREDRARRWPRSTPQRKSVEDWLASPSAYAEEEKETLKEHIAQQGDLAWQLARLETEWLEISEALEKVALEP